MKPAAKNAANNAAKPAANSAANPATPRATAGRSHAGNAVTAVTLPATALPPGGGALPADSDAAQIAAQAAEQGMLFATADCDRARSRSAVLRAVARALDAAEYFGGDFDGLFDSLCDTIAEQKTGLVLCLHSLHSGDPALMSDAARLETVCQDASEYARDHGKVFCYRITHAGRHPDPEPGQFTPWSAAGK